MLLKTQMNHIKNLTLFQSEVHFVSTSFQMFSWLALQPYFHRKKIDSQSKSYQMSQEFRARCLYLLCLITDQEKIKNYSYLLYPSHTFLPNIDVHRQEPRWNVLIKMEGAAHIGMTAT